jgi:hypothetical protein
MLAQTDVLAQKYPGEIRQNVDLGGLLVEQRRIGLEVC